LSNFQVGNIQRLNWTKNTKISIIESESTIIHLTLTRESKFIMQDITTINACSILNSNEHQIENIKNNFKVISMKKEVNDYAASFNSFAVKTAQITLEMCRVVHEAKKDLTKSEFDKFCIAIGRKEEEKDSTIRKYLAIGERYPEFIAYADRMPNSWTSIYLITTIPADKLLDLISKAKSLKNLTAQQIKQLISDESSNQEKKKSLIENSSVSIFFTREPTIVEWNTLKVQLNALIDVKALNLRFEFSKKFENRHNKSKKENAADAKMKRKMQKESQKKIDEQDFVYSPLFDYGGMYDYSLGKFID